MQMSHRVSLLSLLSSAVVLAGCGDNGAVTPVTAGFQQTSRVAPATPRVPKCKGQTTVGHGAEVEERIPREGATLCVPSFRGFGGTLGFPGVDPAPEPIALRVTVPSRGMERDGAAPIFNLQWLPSAQFRFGKSAPPGGISGATMIPGKPYTGYGVIGFKGSSKRVGPCYSIAAPGKYRGIFNDLGTLMENQGGSFITWDLTIYPGKETKRRCGGGNFSK